MQLRRVSITRFRGIENLVLHPGRFTVLIGPNNSAKTTILEALDLLLHHGIGRPRLSPTELDYYGRDTADAFRIEAVLGDLPADLTADVVDHLEGWRSRDQAVLAEPDGDGVETVLRVQALGTPDLDLSHTFAKPESGGARFAPALRKRVGWFFDGRAQDPARELAFSQGGVLEQLFDEVDLDPAIEALRAALSSGAAEVTADRGVSAVLDELGADLRTLGLLAEEQLPIFEAGETSRRVLLQNLSLALPRPDGVSIPIGRHGRGTQRLTLIMLLLRVWQARHHAPIAAFVLPELGLVPLRQTQLVHMMRKVSEAGGQLFVETASPSIVRGFTLDDLVLLPELGTAGTPRPLALLSPPAKQGYERRLDGAVVPALFAPLPLLVEGPGDRPVLETFWTALTASEALPSMPQLGVDVINCEGADMQPQMARLLQEAGKPVLAWAEQDVPKVLAQLRDNGHCVALLVHDAAKGRQKLEESLAVGVPLAGLVAGLEAIARDRDYDWDAQRADLLSRCSQLPRAHRDLAGAATDVAGFLAVFPESEARALVARTLAASGVTPFEMKGARQARLFAEAVVDTCGVPQSYATALRALVEWLRSGRPSAADGTPVEFALLATTEETGPVESDPAP